MKRITVCLNIFLFSFFLTAQNNVSVLLSSNQILMQTTQGFRMDEGVIEEDAKSAADFIAKQNALTQAAKYFILNSDKFSQPPTPEETNLYLNDLIQIKTEESKKIYKDNKNHLNRNLVLVISLPAMEHRLNAVRKRSLLKHAYHIDKIRRDALLRLLHRFQSGDNPPPVESVQSLLKQINATDWLNRGLSNRADNNRLEYLNQALALDANYHFARYQRAKTCYRLRQFETVLQETNRLLPEHQNWLELYNLRGLALGQLQRFNEALADYNQVLDSDPENISALVNRGVALSHTGQTDAAIDDYKTALSLNGEPTLIQYNMGCAYALKGETGKALKSLEKSLSKGYKEFDAMEEDPDLAGLKSDPKFQELIDKYRELNVQ